MYQPEAREDQIRALYRLSQARRVPMTQLIRQALDEYLTRQASDLQERYERAVAACLANSAAGICSGGCSPEAFGAGRRPQACCRVADTLERQLGA